MSKKIKKVAPKDLKKNQILTTDEWDFIVSSQGKTFFVEKDKVGEYLGNSEYATARVGKGYTKGKLSDGTEIIYPTNDLEGEKTEALSFEVSTKTAYVAYVSCMEAKRQGKDVSFAMALAYYSAHPEDAEKVADVVMGEEKDSPRALEVWKPNFTIVDEMNETLTSNELTTIEPAVFINENVDEKVVSADDNVVDNENKPTETTGNNANKKKVKPILKKAIAGVVALAVLAGGAFGIRYAIEKNKDSDKNNSQKPAVVEDLDVEVENALDGNYLSYEMRGGYLYVCEKASDDQSISFARLKLGSMFNGVEELNSYYKHTLAIYVKSHKAEFETLGTLELKSGRNIVLVEADQETTKTTILNQITKGANPYNKEADARTITVVGSPSIAFDRTSETGYKTSVTMYSFSGHNANGEMSSKVYTISSDCDKNATADEQMQLLANSEEISEMTLLENYSPAGLFKGVKASVKNEKSSTAESTITDGAFVKEQRKLYDAGVLKASESIQEKVMEANGVKYYKVVDSKTYTKNPYLYAVKYDAFDDVVDSKKYIDVREISSDSNGIKLVTELINSEKTDSPVYVEVVPAERFDSGLVESYLNLVSFNKDANGKAYQVNILNNALRMEAEEEDYLMEYMFSTYVSKLRGEYVSVPNTKLIFSGDIETQVAVSSTKGSEGQRVGVEK